MTIDVVAHLIDDQQGIRGGTLLLTGRPRWGAETIYREYTRKWLRAEAARPPRLLDRTDRERLVRVAARTIFLRQGAAGPAAVRDVTDLSVSRAELAESIRSAGAVGELADLTERYAVAELADELCMRTFLILSTGVSDGYRFVHKSFLEFYVALDLWTLCQTAGDPDHPRTEAALQTVTATFARPLPDEVVRFFREMLEASRTEPVERSWLSHGLLEVFVRAAALPQPRSRTVRQHAGNLLTHIAPAPLARRLRDIAADEADPFVKRGLIVGLAMNHGYTSDLDDYVRHLREDRKAAEIQVGYTRIYHGDQVFEGDWSDDGSPACDRTVREMVMRLRRGYHPMLWSLTLFTLNYLMETGRGRQLLSPDSPERLFLADFLSLPRREAGRSFERERLILLPRILHQDPSHDPCQPRRGSSGP